jgi:hypothetical protein
MTSKVKGLGPTRRRSVGGVRLAGRFPIRTVRRGGVDPSGRVAERGFQSRTFVNVIRVDVIRDYLVCCVGGGA